MIRGAQQRPDEAYVPQIRANFAKLSPAAKYEALELLARLRSATAAKVYVTLVRENARTLQAIPVETLRQRAENTDAFFPALLEIASQNPQLGGSIYLLAVSYIDKRRLDPRVIAPAGDSLAAAYMRRHPKLVAMQQRAGFRWVWEPSYQVEREPAAMLLDLLGYVPPQIAEPPLRKALALSDPRLKLFAILSLVRLQKDVAYRDLEMVAASDETRAPLFEQLEMLRRLDLFPNKYATQPLLAQSCMVQWLIFPTELGRAPDEIELAATIPADDPNRGDYYVFRFRVEALGESASYAGVAGPYPPGRPTVHDGGDTFSRFDKWETLKPQEHLQRILTSLHKARGEATSEPSTQPVTPPATPRLAP
jgi:hypothetical protein